MGNVQISQPGAQAVEKAEFVIVGGGPGGIAAAIEAAKAGVHVILLDENVQLGGQIFRQPAKGMQLNDLEVMGKDYKKGLQLFSQFIKLKDKINYLNDATVWGVFADRTLAYVRNGGSHKLKFDKLLIAAGAYDRPVPFPGWTLPGVMTAGGAQKMVKTDRILPGDKILLAGTGPLQLALADQLIQSGASIAAILEVGDFKKRWLSIMKGMWGNWDYMDDGWRYLRHIQKAGIPLMHNHIITQAHGKDRVEAAVIARVDKDWRPIAGTRQTVQVDTICLGYGLVTSSELTFLAECEHAFKPALGGYVPLRTENMETTQHGIYAVGDGARVAGSKVAIEEGKIAGIAVAKSLNYVSDQEMQRVINPSRALLGRYIRLRKVLDDISAPRPGLFELADDETIICRCEDITLKAVKAAASHPGVRAKDVKRKTRIGMGSCGGRMCGPILVGLLAAMNGTGSKTPENLTPRPPIKPISLGELATNANSGPD